MNWVDRFRGLLADANYSDIHLLLFLRKEVIQPQVPLRLPCYDFTPVADYTVVKGLKPCLKVEPTPMV